MAVISAQALVDTQPAQAKLGTRSAQEPPSAVRVVAPAYPPIGAAAGVSATVTIEVQVTTDGHVSSARLVRGVGVFAAAAKNCATLWTFEPITRSVTRTAHLTFDFKIMPPDTPPAELTPIFKPPYRVEVRAIVPDVLDTRSNDGKATVIFVDKGKTLSSASPSQEERRTNLLPIRLGRAIVKALFARGTKEISTPPKQIVLTGKLLDGEIMDEGTEGVKLSVRLRLDFRNVSPESVLILKRDLEVVERKIFAHHADAAGQNYLFRFEAYPSIDTSPEWAELRKKVDYPMPQSDVVRILSPNEVWSWETTDWFMIGKTTNIDENSKPWAAIQQASPVWLQVTFELWPKNIEPHPEQEELNLAKLLQHSWQPFGELQFGQVTSDPILLDLSSFTTKVASRKNN